MNVDKNQCSIFWDFFVVANKNIKQWNCTRVFCCELCVIWQNTSGESKVWPKQIIYFAFTVNFNKILEHYWKSGKIIFSKERYNREFNGVTLICFIFLSNTRIINVIIGLLNVLNYIKNVFFRATFNISYIISDFTRKYPK